MIQRVQTLYLATLIILLSMVTFGSTLFSFVNEASRFEFSSYGIVEYSELNNEIIDSQTFPFFIGTISLILIAFITLMSFKNLDRQFKLGRMVFYIYFIMLISVIVLATFGDSMLDVETNRREMGLGFFLFSAGFPFSFLANTGIKRDRALLNSLDRLR
ncbi:MAG: DUF4293 family protein [Crocinitomicaceae bacterium]|nr:DUF4293 family protein [Crocinitomicaceae bacterium]MDG1776859.1 DUF4293 family protein [Crocinitomicaceae bacterium]